MRFVVVLCCALLRAAAPVELGARAQILLLHGVSA